MSEAQRYEIRTVLDFLKVPPERRADCLEEFAVFLEVAEASVNLMDAVAIRAGVSGALRTTIKDTYLWIDDGRRDIHANINVAATPSREAPSSDVAEGGKHG